MEIAVGVKAVEHKGMASVGRKTAIQDWPTGTEFINQHLIPLLCTIIVTSEHITLLAIIKISL